MKCFKKNIYQIAAPSHLHRLIIKYSLMEISNLNTPKVKTSIYLHGNNIKYRRKITPFHSKSIPLQNIIFPL